MAMLSNRKIQLAFLLIILLFLALISTVAILSLYNKVNETQDLTERVDELEKKILNRSVEVNTVSLELEEVEFHLEYDSTEIGEATVSIGDEECSFDASIGFSLSDIRLFINACGLGGVSREEVGSFKTTALTGEEFIISYDNCVAVLESDNDLERYEREKNTIGQTCRNYFLGSGYSDAQISILFHLKTTPDKVDEANAQIKKIVSGLSIYRD